MPSPTPRARGALALVVGLLASLLVLVPGTGAVAAGNKGYVDGEIICPPLAKCPKIKVLWFDADWNFIGQKRANGGGYSLTLPPGVYHLQFVDQRPAYDVTKFAPTDIRVTVRANDQSGKTVRMQKGAAVTGTVRADGRGLGGATVIAAMRGTEQSYQTVADSRGRFAIGGLPQAQYSLFTWDKRRAWVAKSTWAGSVKPTRTKHFPIRLTDRAGNMTLRLFTPNGLLRTKTTLTVVSKSNHQWWTATSGNGTFVFRGLYPGRYAVKFDGAGVWFAKSGTVQQAVVRSGRMSFGSFHLTERGGWIEGSLVDGDGRYMVPLKPGYTNGPGATIRLFNASGHEIARTTSDENGAFLLEGQLATQDGLTITVDPPAGGYLRGEEYCHFDHAEFTGYSVASGEGRYVGQLPVPRTPGQTSPGCLSRTP